MDENRAVVAGASGITFYKIDSAKVSFKEYWWATKGPSFLVAAIVKPLRMQIPSGSDDAAVSDIATMEVGEDWFSSDARERLSPLLAELQTLGFTSPAYYVIDNAQLLTQLYQIVKMHPSGQAVARAHNRVWGIKHPPKSVVHCDIITEFEDGSFLWTTSAKADCLAPPNCRVNRLRGANAQKLWDSHQKLLAATGKTARPVRDSSEIRELVERHHAAVTKFHVDRGVFVPLSDAEVARAEEIRQKRASGDAAAVANAGVLMELERLQNKRNSWTTTILILLVSLLAFIGAGYKSQGWEFLLLIIPILLFHEMGHYIAMRIFGYRNLRMFFIPFLGAAVSGQNYSAPGWKKVIVALAGPLPGLVVGTVLVGIGMFRHQDLLFKAGMLTLILNGFNLLPVYPLDGGRVMHTLLFCRHYLADIAFRIIAATALIGLSAGFGDKALMYVGIFMLVGVPLAFKVARVANELRKSGVRVYSPDDKTIPTDIAQLIVSKLKEGQKRPVTNKVLAQQTLNVFETLATRPPGWPATIALGGVHMGSFVVCVLVVVLLFVFHVGGGFGKLVQAAASMPKQPVTPQNIVVQKGNGAEAGAAGGRTTIVGDFKTEDDARSAFNGWTPRMPETSVLTIFGKTVMLALPAKDESSRGAWVTEFDGKSKQVFVQANGRGGNWTFSCIAPAESTAAEIEQAAQEYFESAGAVELIPPWLPNDTRTAEQRRVNHIARQTYRKLNGRGETIREKDDEAAALTKQLTEAIRKGDSAALKRIQEEQTKHYEQLRQRNIADLRKLGPDQVDLEMVDAYVEYMKVEPKSVSDDEDPADEPDHGAWRKQFDKYQQLATQHMGPIETVKKKPVKGSDRYCAYGHCTRAGVLLNWHWMSFRSPAEGAPAMIDWLAKQKCGSFKYDVKSTVEFFGR